MASTARRTMIAVQTAIGHMEKSGGGSIINISSLAGQSGLP